MNSIEQKALMIRKEIIKTCYLGRGGHIPPSLSAVDIMVELYFDGILHYDAQKPGRKGTALF